ncbi:MAG TPA: DUF2802 domain-containing protein [Gammaproteobacteria bacterium]
MNALILLVSSLMLLLSLALWVWSKKHIESLRQQLDQQLQSSKLNSELGALNAGTIGLGERFLKLEKNMQQLSMRLDEMSNEVQSHSPYSYAISLAQKGETAETIAELCHISLSEAQLLVMMHQQHKAA